jgi:hypothetical protein
MKLAIGQRVAVELFGLSFRVRDAEADGTIVDLAPGAVTVRLGANADVQEVCVSQNRVRPAA